MKYWIKKHQISLLTCMTGVCFFLSWYLPRIKMVQIRSLKSIAGMTEAGIRYITWDKKPMGVLVLSPTYNMTCGQLIYDEKWQTFARENHLALIEIAFASELDDLLNGDGYYYVKKGSGKLLLTAIEDLWPGDLPLLLYGFSGGAHFTARFVEWKPERVIAWSAYSAGWWDIVLPWTSNPPGIVICGELDDRFRATSQYYQQGRNLEKPWLWLGIANSPHIVDERIPDFVRNYFGIMLREYPQINNGLETKYGWIPSAELLLAIKELSTVKPYKKKVLENVKND